MFGIRAAAAREKRLRIEREIERRRQEEAQRLRLQEQSRIERLKGNVARWEEAQRTKAYLAAVRERAVASPGGYTEYSPLFRFLSWATRYAERLDPSAAPSGADWEIEES